MLKTVVILPVLYVTISLYSMHQKVHIGVGHNTTNKIQHPQYVTRFITRQNNCMEKIKNVLLARRRSSLSLNKNDRVAVTRPTLIICRDPNLFRMFNKTKYCSPTSYPNWRCSKQSFIYINTENNCKNNIKLSFQSTYRYWTQCTCTWRIHSVY